jgi:hypothetical protein
MIVKLSVDLCWNDDEELADALERLSKSVPSAWVRIEQAQGPAGGWPLVSVMLDDSDLEAFAVHYWGVDRDMYDLEDLFV